MKDVSISLEDHSLTDASINAIETISQAASTHAVKAYLVGGIVRDIVARIPRIATSPDVTIIGDVAKFAETLASENADCTIVSLSQHHTAKVKIGDITIDIASARTDTYEPWGSLPQITPVDEIQADLQRRDFTVNAMAIRLAPHGLGELIDPFNGRSDADNKVMRVIRNHHHSFPEDPLRILRGIRLAARYGYAFDPETAKSIHQSLYHLKNMCDASPQRVFNELRLWFLSHENLDAIISVATEHRVLDVLLPSASFRESIFRRIPADATELERFAAFAYLAPPKTMTALAKKLKIPSDWHAIVTDAIITQEVAEKCRSEIINDFYLRRSLIQLRDEVIQAAINFETDPEVSKRFTDYRARLRNIRTDLSGDDLIALGIQQGPMIGQLLDELLARRVDGTIANADQERTYITRRLTDG